MRGVLSLLDPEGHLRVQGGLVLLREMQAKRWEVSSEQVQGWARSRRADHEDGEEPEREEGSCRPDKPREYLLHEQRSSVSQQYLAPH